MYLRNLQLEEPNLGGHLLVPINYGTHGVVIEMLN